MPLMEINGTNKLVSYEILSQVNDKYTVNKVERLIDKPHDTAKNHKIASYKGSFR
jgi:cyclic pyranopterin phosphate synthase